MSSQSDAICALNFDEWEYLSKKTKKYSLVGGSWGCSLQPPVIPAHLFAIMEKTNMLFFREIGDILGQKCPPHQPSRLKEIHFTYAK